MNKWVWLCAVLFVGFVIAPDVDAAEGRIVIAQPSDPTTFDAHVFSDQPTYNLILNVYETLVERGADMKLHPLLAESYKILDERTWQFKLRKGIKFTNGEPFNAAVVKWNVERMIDPQTKSRNIGRVRAIERIDIVDDFTVNIVTKVPYPILDAQLSRVVHMMPPKYFQEKGAAHVGTNPVGTGPYKVVKWIRDDQLVFEANEHYWRGTAKIGTVVFKPIPEATTRVNALINGEVDIAMSVPPHLLKDVERGVRAEVRKVPSLEVMMVSLYNQVNPTNSKLVRQAINYGVNVEAILKNVMLGHGERRAGILAKEAFGFDPSVTPYPYDPEKAKALLKEANYPADYDFVVNTPVGRYLNEKAIGEAVAGELQKIGIKARVKLTEWGNYTLQVVGHKLFPMHLQGWGPPSLDADDVYSTNLRSGSPFAQFNDERLDQLVDAARSTFDKEKRLSLYGEIARFQKEEATHLFLWQSMNFYGVNKHVNWSPRPDEYVKMYDASLR